MKRLLLALALVIAAGMLGPAYADWRDDAKAAAGSARPAIRTIGRRQLRLLISA